MSRLDRKHGRFDTTYEAGVFDGALTDFQDVNGDWIDYYRYSAENSGAHHVYSEPDQMGRVFAGPVRVPVLQFVRDEGAAEAMKGGLHWTDTAHTTVPYAGLEAAGITETDMEHGASLRDRIVYDDRPFRITMMRILGQLRRRDIVVGISMTQLKPEDLVGDLQFVRWHRREHYPVFPHGPNL